jgi:hypothetical protein
MAASAFEVDETQVILERLENADAFVDVGANVGTIRTWRVVGTVA